MYALIRLLLQEQSDLGQQFALTYLSKNLSLWCSVLFFGPRPQFIYCVCANKEKLWAGLFLPLLFACFRSSLQVCNLYVMKIQLVLHAEDFTGVRLIRNQMTFWLDVK